MGVTSLSSYVTLIHILLAVTSLSFTVSQPAGRESSLFCTTVLYYFPIHLCFVLYAEGLHATPWSYLFHLGPAYREEADRPPQSTSLQKLLVHAEVTDGEQNNKGREQNETVSPSINMGNAGSLDDGWACEEIGGTSFVICFTETSLQDDTLDSIASIKSLLAV